MSWWVLLESRSLVLIGADAFLRLGRNVGRELDCLGLTYDSARAPHRGHRRGGEETLDELANGVRIAQRVSPRVALVEASHEDMRRLEAAPGVEVVVGELPDELAEQLDATETLFARAWGRRVSGSTTRRRGNGLRWDSPGFEPPDPDSSVHRGG